MSSSPKKAYVVRVGIKRSTIKHWDRARLGIPLAKWIRKVAEKHGGLALEDHRVAYGLDRGPWDTWIEVSSRHSADEIRKAIAFGLLLEEGKALVTLREILDADENIEDDPFLLWEILAGKKDIAPD